MLKFSKNSFFSSNFLIFFWGVKEKRRNNVVVVFKKSCKLSYLKKLVTQTKLDYLIRSCGLKFFKWLHKLPIRCR
jgi:hypothetical protein